MNCVNCYLTVFLFWYFSSVPWCNAQNLNRQCMTFYNNTGECVDSELCPPIQAIIKNKTRNQAASRYVAKSFCHKMIEIVDGVQRYMVCCDINDVNNGCVMPEVQNGYFEFITSDVSPSNRKVPWDTILVLKCAEKFIPKPTNTIYCRNNGSWSRDIECHGTCPYLVTSSTVKTKCFQRGNQISCDGPMSGGTIVDFACEVGHIPENENDELESVTCLGTTWSTSAPKCVNLASLPLDKLESTYESVCKDNGTCLSQFLKIIIAKRKVIQMSVSKIKDEVIKSKETIIVFGGYDKYELVNSVETYNMDSNIWTLKEVQFGREFFSSVLFQEKIFIIGGLNKRYKRLNTVESFDLKTWSKTILAPMNHERADFPVAVVGNFIYVTGGSGNGLLTISSMERYDPTTQAWTLLTNMPNKKRGHGAVTVDEQMYVIGGWNEKDEYLDMTERYSTSTGQWTTLQPLIEKRSSFAITAIDEFIFVFGGISKGGTLSSIERYDIRKDEWVNLKPLSAPRQSLQAVIFEGRLVISGGAYGDLTTSNKVEQYDMSDWKALPSFNMARRGHQMIIVPRKLIA